LVAVLASTPKPAADLSSLSAEEVKEQPEYLTSKVAPAMAVLASRGEDNDMHDPPQASSPAPPLPLPQLPTAPSQTPEPPAKADPPKLPIDLPVSPVSPGTPPVQPSESADPPGRRDSGAIVPDVPNLPVPDLSTIPNVLGDGN
jgi:hypothetical protein